MILFFIILINLKSFSSCSNIYAMANSTLIRAASSSLRLSTLRAVSLLIPDIAD